MRYGIAVLCAGFGLLSAATAAPVPKGPPPPNPKANAALNLNIAKYIAKGHLQYIQITELYDYQVAKEVSETVVLNDQQVTVKKTVYENNRAHRVLSLPLAKVKATAADGKELDAEALAEKLGDGGSVVQVVGPFDPEWRKLFTDDVIFLELLSPVSK